MDLDANHGGAWLFGKLCYWIGGQHVGDWELGTSLRDALSGITSIARDSGRRENCGLFGLPSETVFHRIDRTLYGANFPLPEDVVEGAAYYDAVPPVDVFRDWKAYLVECGGQARLLYQGPRFGVQEFRLKSGEFDRAILEAHAQLDAWYEREVPNGSR